MTVYGCRCPFGCPRHAEPIDLCENCRLGFHGRYCSAFVPRPPDTDAFFGRTCADCGGWPDDHPGDPHYGREPQPEPHAPAGLIVPAPPGPPAALSRSSILVDPEERPSARRRGPRAESASDPAPDNAAGPAASNEWADLATPLVRVPVSHVEPTSASSPRTVAPARWRVTDARAGEGLVPGVTLRVRERYCQPWFFYNAYEVFWLLEALDGATAGELYRAKTIQPDIAREGDLVLGPEAYPAFLEPVEPSGPAGDEARPLGTDEPDRGA